MIKFGKSRPFVLTLLIITLLVLLMELKGNEVVNTYANTEIQNKTPTETTYIIVDIFNYVYNADLEGTTELYCEMPNGDFEIYTITDAPEKKCTIACLATENLEDYTTYKVVAVR